MIYTYDLSYVWKYFALFILQWHIPIWRKEQHQRANLLFLIELVNLHLVLAYLYSILSCSDNICQSQNVYCFVIQKIHIWLQITYFLFFACDWPKCSTTQYHDDSENLLSLFENCNSLLILINFNWNWFWQFERKFHRNTLKRNSNLIALKEFL